MSMLILVFSLVLEEVHESLATLSKQSQRVCQPLDFLVLFGLSLCAEIIANDKPLIVRYDGQFYFPIVKNQAETVFGGDFTTPTDFLDPDIRRNITSNGNWLFIRQLLTVMKPSIIFLSLQTLRHHHGRTG